jgi:N-acetylmuramoyl-L-alanine amidase
LVESIAWIKNRCRPEDVAIEMHADAFSNPQVRGASQFYIGSNPKRKLEANLILNGSFAGTQKYRIAAQKQILKSVLVASNFVAA